MPRNGSGVYSLPAGSDFSPNTTIESSKVNAINQDLKEDANNARPVSAGGTGATDASTARTNLGLVIGKDVTAVSSISTYFYGLELFNDLGDLTNDIYFSAGNLVLGDQFIDVAGGVVKRLDANWSVGTGQGGLDTGAIANTWYYAFVIRRPDTGVVDFLFSASAGSPTMPANYTQKRRLGCFLRSGGSIVKFKQYGDNFIFDQPRQDVSASNPGTAAVSRNLSLPTKLEVLGDVGLEIVTTTVSTAINGYVNDPDQTDYALGTMHDLRLNTASAAGTYRATVRKLVRTSSGAVKTKLDFSDAPTAIVVTTYGWLDMRNRSRPQDVAS